MNIPRVGYGTKLAAGSVALVLAVGLVVVGLIDRALAADLLADLDARLERQARGAAIWAAEGRHPERLAVRLGGIVGTQVTILNAAGHIVGASEVGVVIGADASRDPEIAAALSGGIGRATRASATGASTRFLAIRAERSMVLRLGASLEAISGTVDQVRSRLALASAIGVGLAIGLSLLTSRLAARPLRAMRDAAARIADGDYAVTLAGESPDEFGELERSLSVLAARLAADRERIDRLEVMRRDFVANVSHELRTPVTAIQGYAETLLQGSADAATAERFLRTMHRQSLRIGALVTDLLRLAELEARLPADSRREAVRLVDAVRQSVATVIEKRREPLDVAVRIADDVRVTGDPLAIEQVVENLVENAARYGGAHVAVSAERVNGRVRFSVHDDGPGIPKEHLPRLFERFYRIDVAQSRAEGGTGLGLAIVKHLTEAMGGSVTVESAAGEGTRFTVELPGVA